jgi:creatinine amidohydrolase
MRSPWLQELRWPEIEAHLKTDDVVLIPIGATEQHGRHLPLLVDSGWAIAASEGAARIAKVLIAPPLQLGWSPHHMGYPGTITLGADTLRRVAVDMAQSLICHGFRRIIFVNGNRIANLPPLEIAIVEIKNRTGAYAGIADAGLIAKQEFRAICGAADGGLDHAGEAETSFALHWAPAHVDMNEARPPERGHNGRRSQFDYSIELDPELHGNAVSFAVSPAEHRRATAPDGTANDPRLATAEKGRQMVEALARNLAAYIEEVRKLPLGEVHGELPI